MFDVASITTWPEYDAASRVVEAQFSDFYQLCTFDYVHPTRLQRQTPKDLRKPYAVPSRYTEWGNPDNPTIICLGGVANTAMRFNYLAHELSSQFHVVCLDWLGRGVSGWLYALTDYGLPTYVEQLTQLIQHLKKRSVHILGSSLGGSVAIAYAAAHRSKVQSMILNDVGPYIPQKRRRRRSQVLGRYYVFRTPADLLRRLGAAQKNDGPLGDYNRFCNAYYLTRWSPEEQARVYRYDLRAMLAYAEDARTSLEQWDLWQKISCPILAIHGLLSDVLTEQTIQRMRKGHRVDVMHVPDTGHTPALSDSNQIHYVKSWLDNTMTHSENWSVIYAHR